MFFSAWREKIFLEDLTFNLTLLNGSAAGHYNNNNNTSRAGAIPNDIWATRVLVFAVGGTAIAALGLLCNVISIIVLSNFRQKSSAPFLLICLEVVDCVLLLTEMMLETLATLSQAGLLADSYRDFIRPVYVVLYPLPHVAQTGSTMLTVVITIERYIAVARPLLASTVCSKTWARRVVMGVLVWSLLFHVPLYLAYSHHRDTGTAGVNATSRIVFHRTEFGQSHFYNYWFVVWINFICEFLTPFVLIVVFNVLVVRALRASKTLASVAQTGGGGVKLKGGGGGSSHRHAAANKRSAREGKLTGMVVAVTIIFFVCELFPAVALIMMRGKDAFSECSAACANFVSLADTMVLLNSAVNFVAYCAIGEQFRDIFARIFLRRRSPCHRGRRRRRMWEELQTGVVEGEQDTPTLLIDVRKRSEGGGGGGGGGENGQHLLLFHPQHHHRCHHHHHHQHHHQQHADKNGGQDRRRSSSQLSDRL